MNDDNVLDDLNSIDKIRDEFTGTWWEWSRGLVIGFGIQILSFLITSRMGNDIELNGSLKILSLDFNYTFFIITLSSFMIYLPYLLFSYAWRQPLIRIALLGVISSLFSILGTMLVMNVVGEVRLYESLKEVVFQFIGGIVLFLIVALLFRKKSRYFGLAIIIFLLLLVSFF